MKPITVAILIFLAGLSSSALAAMANPLRFYLERSAYGTTPRDATHIVVGTIIDGYEQRIEPGGGFIIQNRIAIIRIKEIEKGEGLKNGDLVYAHYGTVSIPAGATSNPSDPGYQGRIIPRVGMTLRVYLIRKPYTSNGNQRFGNLEGAFTVAERNGFQVLGQATKP